MFRCENDNRGSPEAEEDLWGTLDPAASEAGGEGHGFAGLDMRADTSVPGNTSSWFLCCGFAFQFPSPGGGGQLAGSHA